MFGALKDWLMRESKERNRMQDFSLLLLLLYPNAVLLPCGFILSSDKYLSPAQNIYS
jgi:hypothetical protein